MSDSKKREMTPEEFKEYQHLKNILGDFPSNLDKNSDQKEK